jgi:hypothetical protein
MPNLTRNEWANMWECVRSIESIAEERSSLDKRLPVTAAAIRLEVNRIKELIQKVIGEMK